MLMKTVCCKFSLQMFENDFLQHLKYGTDDIVIGLLKICTKGVSL